MMCNELIYGFIMVDISVPSSSIDSCLSCPLGQPFARYSISLPQIYSDFVDGISQRTGASKSDVILSLIAYARRVHEQSMRETYHQNILELSRVSGMSFDEASEDLYGYGRHLSPSQSSALAVQENQDDNS